MEEYYAGGSDRISIGEMAEIFHISTRTLRLYHDMGLLVPQHVNDANGYRYYSRSQFRRLETILQMKSLGLPLGQIKTMLTTRDLSVFEALLNERIDELSERIAEDTAARALLIKQLNSCAHLRNLPVLDSAFIEFIPKRHALTFDIEPYDLRCTYTDGSPWKRVLEKIKRALAENNLSPSLLNQVCCTIPPQNLLEGSYLCSGALLLTDGPLQTGIPARVVQSGVYACLYRNYTAMDGKSECVGLDRLLQFIRDSQYKIAGPYLGEVVAKMSIFDYNNDTILVKLQIPVKISG